MQGRPTRNPTLLIMAILIDPPSWPAHGTVFSHLVSTSSLAELHGFARSAGIPSRAFDEDHYDVPARRYDDLVERGAEQVSGTFLVRALIESGLRVPARRRPARLRAALVSRWAALLPGESALGEELLDRWDEPTRSYHTHTHLLAVLEALDLLLRASDGPDRASILLAAWFHDAVYQGAAGDDERASAALAGARLDGRVEGRVTAEVQRLILLTQTHDPASNDRPGQLLCDADLSVLGGEPIRYAHYLGAVRQEYSHIPDEAFTRSRTAVVERLLALDPLYRTEQARERWAEQAQHNLTAELASLQAGRAS